MPQRLPARQAISGPIEMPAQAPYGQGHLAYGAECAARALASYLQFEPT
jgi:hypothetical protein